jgi:hypothetical protein
MAFTAQCACNLRPSAWPLRVTHQMITAYSYSNQIYIKCQKNKLMLRRTASRSAQPYGNGTPLRRELWKAGAPPETLPTEVHFCRGLRRPVQRQVLAIAEQKHACTRRLLNINTTNNFKHVCLSPPGLHDHVSQGLVRKIARLLVAFQLRMWEGPKINGPLVLGFCWSAIGVAFCIQRRVAHFLFCSCVVAAAAAAAAVTVA